MRPAWAPVIRTTDAIGTRPSIGGAGAGEAAGAAAPTTRNPQRPALCSRTSARPRAASSWSGTSTCCSRSPRYDFDGALVSAVDLEAVGERSELADACRLVGQQEPRGVAVLRAGGFEFLERRQPRLHARQFLLAGAGVLPKLLVPVPGVGRAAPGAPHPRLAPARVAPGRSPVAGGRLRARPAGARPRRRRPTVRPRAWPAPPRRARARRRRCRWRAGAS